MRKITEKSIKNRIDFVYMFDVKDGNPNGDPDNGNYPRIDTETGQGIITDVCVKRKMRNFVQVRERPDENRNAIFIRSKEIDNGKECYLNTLIKDTYKEIGVDLEANDKKKDDRVKNNDIINQAKEHMCDKYFDIRTFGGVMSTGVNAGQVCGPVQLTFARSIDPISVMKNAITICAAKKPETDFEKQTGIQGSKYTVPYGLYKCYGFISPRLAQKTGFDTDDLNLMWDALKNMFDEDHSAARGLMTPRAIIAFKHNDIMGNCTADEAFKCVIVKKKEMSEEEGNKAPRSFDDYEIIIDEKNIPEGVTLERIL